MLSCICHRHYLLHWEACTPMSCRGANGFIHSPELCQTQTVLLPPSPRPVDASLCPRLAPEALCGALIRACFQIQVWRMGLPLIRLGRCHSGPCNMGLFLRPCRSGIPAFGRLCRQVGMICGASAGSWLHAGETGVSADLMPYLKPLPCHGLLQVAHSAMWPLHPCSTTAPSTCSWLPSHAQVSGQGAGEC